MAERCRPAWSDGRTTVIGECTLPAGHDGNDHNCHGRSWRFTADGDIAMNVTTPACIVTGDMRMVVHRVA